MGLGWGKLVLQAIQRADLSAKHPRFRLAKFPGSTTLVGLHFEITHR